LDEGSAAISYKLLARGRTYTLFSFVFVIYETRCRNPYRIRYVLDMCGIHIHGVSNKNADKLDIVSDMYWATMAY
jgi:hypothetical protein